MTIKNLIIAIFLLFYENIIFDNILIFNTIFNSINTSSITYSKYSVYNNIITIKL